MTEQDQPPRYDLVKDDLLALSERTPLQQRTAKRRDTPWHRAFRRGHKRRDLPVKPDAGAA